MSVIEDARAEFARQARQVVEGGDPDAIKAAIERFEQARYSLVADEALEILRDALT